jgi:TrmH family RNA methyltransferase
MSHKAVVSSRNAFVRHWVQLQTDPKYRYEQGRYLLTGSKLVKEWLSQEYPIAENVYSISTSKSFFNSKEFDIVKEKLSKQAHKIPELYLLEDWILDKVTDSRSEGIFLELDIHQKPVKNISHNTSPLLLLDGIQDPGNMGTILRSALAFDWHNVITVSPSVDYYHPNVLRASRHAHPWLRLSNIKTPSPDSLLDHIKSISRVPNASNISIKPSPLHFIIAESDPSSKPRPLPLSNISKIENSSIVLVLGSESNGPIRIKECLANISGPNIIINHVHIPIHKKVESLNVSIAAGILMHFLKINRY